MDGGVKVIDLCVSFSDSVAPVDPMGRMMLEFCLFVRTKEMDPSICLLCFSQRRHQTDELSDQVREEAAAVRVVSRQPSEPVLRQRRNRAGRAPLGPRLSPDTMTTTPSGLATIPRRCELRSSCSITE